MCDEGEEIYWSWSLRLCRTCEAGYACPGGFEGKYRCGAGMMLDKLRVRLEKLIRNIPWKGTYSRSGWAHCEDCPVGHRCSWGKKYPCSANEYQHKTGATSCHLCPEGSFSEIGASGNSSWNQNLFKYYKKYAELVRVDTTLMPGALNVNLVYVQN